MDFDLDIRSITHLKNHAADLINEIVEQRKTVAITQNGNARVVMMDVAHYKKMRDAILMMRIVNLGRASADRGELISNDEVFDELESWLQAQDELDEQDGSP